MSTCARPSAHAVVTSSSSPTHTSNIVEVDRCRTRRGRLRLRTDAARSRSTKNTIQAGLRSSRLTSRSADDCPITGSNGEPVAAPPPGMEQHPSPSFLWTCLSCGRRVPRRVDECRYGFTHSETAVVESAHAIKPASTTPNRRLLLLRAAPVVAAFLLGGGTVYLLGATEHADVAKATRTLAPAPAPTTALASESQPAGFTPAVVMFSPTTIAATATTAPAAATSTSLE